MPPPKLLNRLLNRRKDPETNQPVVVIPQGVDNNSQPDLSPSQATENRDELSTPDTSGCTLTGSHVVRETDAGIIDPQPRFPEAQVTANQNGMSIPIPSLTESRTDGTFEQKFSGIKIDTSKGVNNPEVGGDIASNNCGIIKQHFEGGEFVTGGGGVGNYNTSAQQPVVQVRRAAQVSVSKKPRQPIPVPKDLRGGC